MKLSEYLILLSLLFIAIQGNTQVIATYDVDYLDDAVYQEDKDLLDIYMPEDEKNVPVLVYFHGGALLMGNKSWGEELGKLLAHAGIGLVSVNYRLSPEFQHPSHVSDAAKATAWVINNIKTYGGNPDKVYVGGHSAGAYLAALLAIDHSHLRAQGIESSEISGAVLISPFLYVEETARDRIARDTIYKTIWGNSQKDWIRASVTPHLLLTRDNILLIYADGDEDWRKRQINTFAEAMIATGNRDISSIEVSNRDHMSILSGINEDDDRVLKLIRDFIK